jgi:hypothetical protein
MNQLISDLTRPGARLFLYVPGKVTIERAATLVTTQLNQTSPNTEVVVVTRDGSRILGGNVISLNLSQVNQAFLDIFFGLSSPRPMSNRVLIIEAASNLGQFVIPQGIGRILVLGSPFKSMEELNESARFLTGPAAQNLTITPLDTGKLLGTIGYQLVGNNLEFDYRGVPVTIPLSQIQYQEYLLRVERERSLARREPFSALQALNFMYPAQLQAAHNLPREERPAITPDLTLSEGGWIEPQYVTRLRDFSSKLEWLLRYFQQNPGRHVIYTAFNESNGVQVISSFLRLAGFQVVQITGNDRYQDRRAKIEQFNTPTASSIILISNLYAFARLNNVKSLIMFEQHPYDTILNSYLKQIATRTPEPAILVLFLIGTGPNGELTFDVTNYIEMARLINQKDSILNILTTGQINPQRLERYRQNITLENLQAVFQGLRFKPVPI